ncbi:hypothetical protein BC629DRAFT_1441626 [Irpex lacteus]|nr:hypothetical protein BC629DRAFT_1441626 [Irpex lacteus]
MAPSVLLIGLPPFIANADQTFAQRIQDGITKTEVEMSKLGYDYTGLFAHPDINGRQAFTDALKAKEKWDVVLIGFGVRGNKDHTEFFEWLVNEVVRIAPGAKLGFPVMPEDTMETAKRLVPI